MPQVPSPEEVLRLNPQVDPRELEEGRELLRRLREAGVGTSRRKLASPLTRRRAVIDDDPEKDPRTVHLRTPK